MTEKTFTSDDFSEETVNKVVSRLLHFETSFYVEIQNNGKFTITVPVFWEKTLLYELKNANQGGLTHE
jgi:hypothetical protein